MEIKLLSKDFLEKNVQSFIDVLSEFNEEYWTEQEFLIDLPLKWSSSIVAVEGQSIAGYIIVSRKQASYHIHKFMVNAKFRSKGLGKKMFGYLTNNIINEGNVVITLKVYLHNSRAIKFYQNLSFVDVRRSEDLLEMEFKHKKKVVAIHQPNFIPWAGYFHKLLLSDVFVFFDDVQFPRGKSYGSRALIKTNSGELWITVPVSSKGDLLSFNEVCISNETTWSEKLLKTISFSYKKSPYFELYFPLISSILSQRYIKLVDLNVELITTIARQMDYHGTFIKSSEMGVAVKEAGGEEKILAILSELQATDYISGTGAGSQRFVRNESFEKAGVNLIWQLFNPPVYPQLYKTFISNLSIIDILFNMGPGSKDVILMNNVV